MILRPTTVLALWGMGVPPYSARGLHQTIEPIQEQPHLERTIDGGLIDLGYHAFQKYKSTITGDDQQPPAVDGVWGGKIITVDCIVELCVPEYVLPQRTEVPGSVRMESGFLFYRPKLTMMVFAFSLERDEYGAQVSWQLSLEEV